MSEHDELAVRTPSGRFAAQPRAVDLGWRTGHPSRCERGPRARSGHRGGRECRHRQRHHRGRHRHRQPVQHQHHADDHRVGQPRRDPGDQPAGQRHQRRRWGSPTPAATSPSATPPTTRPTPTRTAEGGGTGGAANNGAATNVSNGTANDQHRQGHRSRQPVRHQHRAGGPRLRARPTGRDPRHQPGGQASSTAGVALANTGGNFARGNDSDNDAGLLQQATTDGGGLANNNGSATNDSNGKATINTGDASATGNESTPTIIQPPPADAGGELGGLVIINQDADVINAGAGRGQHRPQLRPSATPPTTTPTWARRAPPNGGRPRARRHRHRVQQRRGLQRLRRQRHHHHRRRPPRSATTHHQHHPDGHRQDRRSTVA